MTPNKDSYHATFLPKGEADLNHCQHIFAGKVAKLLSERISKKKYEPLPPRLKDQWKNWKKKTKPPKPYKTLIVSFNYCSLPLPKRINSWSVTFVKFGSFAFQSLQPSSSNLFLDESPSIEFHFKI